MPAFAASLSPHRAFRRVRLLALIPLLFAFSCSFAAPLRVITSNTLLHDWTANVVGDLATASPASVSLACLLPHGADPHTYSPRPADVRQLASAEIAIVNGLGFEPWAERLVRNSGFSGTLITASAGITPLINRRSHGDHHHDDNDPHHWHDLANVIHAVETIRAALTTALPEHADAFAANAAAYTESLLALDAYAREKFTAIPVARRKLVTSHDALGYLGRAYGLDIIPISGLRPDHEPNARQLARLIDFIREQQVPAVFIETTANPKLPELLAREAGVAVGGALHTDSLGAPGSEAATFLDLFRTNVDRIVAALQ